MERDYNKPFLKGDLLVYHFDDDSYVHLVVVHVLDEGRAYYCFDRDDDLYRMVYDSPNLHLLCPDFNPDIQSDLDWTNEWVLELYERKFRLAKSDDTDDI
tara:strand:- start:636 stop:935 length:300 start_codon:yes stop_codon:yes gene_type:complete